MKCPECKSEVSSNKRFCDVCGAQIDLSFSKVGKDLIRDFEAEKMASTEGQVRQLLALVVFFFLVVMTISLAIPKPDVPDIAPAWLTRSVRLPEQDPNLQVPKIELKLPGE